MILFNHQESNPAMIGGTPVLAKQIGEKLFTEYLLLVEVAGFLLLAGLVAAYHLAKRALDDENISHSSLKDIKNNSLEKTTHKETA